MNSNKLISHNIIQPWYSMKIKVVKTASKAMAVQVVLYQSNKRIVLQHIGSAHTEEALNDLMISAEEWI